MNIMRKEMNRKLRRRFCSTTLAAVLGFTTIFAGNTDWISQYKVAAANTKTTKVTEEAEQVDAGSYGLRDNIQDGTILHCFDWKYSQIKEELPNIAAAGFTSVQTSPAQKGDGDTWYWLYQPQTFSIQPNALGTKADLQALCDEAEKYGIKVIVDVVANHTRSIGDDGLGSDCYHHDGDAWYTDRYGITHGKIGMPDLNSESSTVQNKVKGYIEELKSVGVDGIRWDAAKHISLPSEGCQFWPAVTSVGIYNYGEILVGPLESGGEGLMKEYTNYMSVTDSKYGQAIREAFERGGVPSSIGNWSERGVAKNKLVYWGESHDTYSNNGEYGEATQLMNQNIIDRAYAIVAGQGKASSLYFSRPYQTDKQSIKAGEKGSTHFTSKEIAAVNHLHNNCVGEKDYYVNGGSAAAVCRESGAVIVKGSGSGQVTIANGGGTTAPGTYTDEISGGTWTVTADTISGNVGESGIAVIYKNNGSGGGQPVQTTTPSKTTEPSKTTTPSNPVVGDYKLYVRVKKSDFTSAPTLYLYDGETTKNDLNGAWPGTAMKEDGDYYVFTSNSYDSGVAILVSGSWRSTADMQPGLSVSGYMEYDKASNKFTAFTPATKTPATKTPATKTPATKKPSKTEEPTETQKVEETKKPTKTETPIEGPSVTASLEDGAVFKTETEDVKLTFKDAKEVTYSVDGGPKKTVDAEKNKSVTVTVGQGKIGNSKVTLEVESTDGSKTNKQTFTYTKEFVKAKGTTTVLSIFANQVAEKITETAETVNGAAETGGMYATNPSGVGKEATITIDGAFSDWSEDMLIAQGGGWDIANAWKGGHENCVLDTYALYGAWDDENLYIGWQMVNTADTWANSGDGPLSDGGRVLDVPLIVALNVGTAEAMTGATLDGSGIWGAGVTFDTRVDHLLYMSGKVGLGNPGFFKAAGSDGLVDYENTDSCSLFKERGISYKMAEGCLPGSIMALEGSQSVDDAYDASAYKDLKSAGHDTTYDSFYEINIPLSELGITKADIEKNGIGAMVVATRGLSAIDCIPHDPSMLDNVSGDCAVDPSTSHEKDDQDIITVPLAAIGNANAGGSGGSVTPSTKTPAKTETPKETEKAAETKTPTKTETPDEKIYCVNFGADKSSPQLNTTTLTLSAEGYDGTEPYTYEFYIDDEVVQKASDKDSYKWTKPEAGEHVIKVVMTDKDGQETVKLKKYVIETEDGGTKTEDPTQKPDTTIAPTQKPEETTKPEKTTSPEKTTKPEETTSPEKTTNPETTKPEETTRPTQTAPSVQKPGESKSPSTSTKPTATVMPTVEPTTKPTTEPTKVPEATKNPSVNDDKGLSVELLTNKSSSQVKGTDIMLIAKTTGGSGEYKYTFIVEKGNDAAYLAMNSEDSSVVWSPDKAGTYRLIVTVTDAETGYVESDYISYKITAKKVLKFSSFKANKSKVVRKKKIVLTASATPSKGKAKYKFYYKRKGSKKNVTIRNYSTTRKIAWKAPSKTGTYYVYCKVKDGSNKTLTKKVTIKVTKK